MSEATEYRTKEDFARDFVPSLKYALNLAEKKRRGENTVNNFSKNLDELIAYAEKAKDEGVIVEEVDNED